MAWPQPQARRLVWRLSRALPSVALVSRVEPWRWLTLLAGTQPHLRRAWLLPVSRSRSRERRSTPVIPMWAALVVAALVVARPVVQPRELPGRQV